MIDQQKLTEPVVALEKRFSPGRVVVWIPQDVGNHWLPDKSRLRSNFPIDQAVVTEVVSVNPSLQSVTVKNVFHQGEGEATTLVPVSRLIPTHTINERPRDRKNITLSDPNKLQGGEWIEVAVDDAGHLIQGYFEYLDKGNLVLFVGRGGNLVIPIVTATKSLYEISNASSSA